MTDRPDPSPAPEQPASTEPDDAPRFTLVHGLAALTAILGAAMIVTALAGGGGPFSYGVVIGLIFLAAGLMRLRLLNLKAGR